MPFLGLAEISVSPFLKGEEMVIVNILLDCLAVMLLVSFILGFT
jgi:hypothetical protein